MSNEYFIYGYFQKYTWRDERTGKSLFRMTTKQNLVMDIFCKKEKIVRNPITKKDERWFVISCDALDICSASYESKTPIKVSGYFKEANKADFGWDFKVTSIEEGAQDEITTIEYLVSDAFCGITYEIATKIVANYGPDIFAFVQRKDAAALLTKETDLSSENIELLISTVKKTIVERQLFEFLSPLDIPYDICAKAVKFYGNNAYELIMRRPYKIGSEVGLSFYDCDRIAHACGIDARDSERLRTAAKTAFKNLSTAGHVWVLPKEYHKELRRVTCNNIFDVELPMSMLLSVMEGVIGSAKINNLEVFYDKELVECEQNIARNILRLAFAVKEPEPYNDNLIVEAQKACNMNLGFQQKMAFPTILKKKGVKILNGGPGTGKTTTIKEILFAYKMMHPDDVIKLCAPTGRAAQRMAESTDMPATTIHRLLEYRPYGNTITHKDASNPIDADFIVVDEVSMADIDIFNRLLCAIKSGTTLVLVGDYDQLESVGPGAVLYDLLNTDDRIVQKCKLTEVYRQKGGSPIIDNAIAIKEGNSDISNWNLCEDFQILKTKSEEETMELLKELMTELYNPDDPFETQVLCPSRTGVSGIDQCNIVLQGLLNPSKKGIRYGNTVFSEKDKIIMTRNNYDASCNYYNGDIGIVKSTEDHRLKVEIRGEIFEIPKELLGDIRLSYGITIHKSQGSEFSNVIIIMPMNPSNMLVRNLLYTAVTRAKKRVYIINEGSALETAVKVTKAGTRRTLLRQFLETQGKQYLTNTN